MINVGKKNRWALIECLKEAFDRALKDLPDNMLHNFTKEKPFYELTLTVGGEKFHRVVLQRELAQANARIKALEKQLAEQEVEESIEE
jgi:hypothetical protein